MEIIDCYPDLSTGKMYFPSTGKDIYTPEIEEYNLGVNACPDKYLQLIKDIELVKEENYDCTAEDVWSYRKRSDIRNGINLRFGNMCNGFPFTIAGIHFHNSECAYLAGAYSGAGEENIRIQHMIASGTNGQKCKRVFRRKEEFTVFQRGDFETFNVQWMLYVIWQKCLQNPSFAGLLKMIPIDAHMVENTTLHKSPSATFWGARNRELMAVRRRAGEKAETRMNFRFKKDRLYARMLAENSENSTGCFTGKNVMGKILKLCSLALILGNEPPINFTVLKSARIHLAGKLLHFTAEQTAREFVPSRSDSLNEVSSD